MALNHWDLVGLDLRVLVPDLDRRLFTPHDHRPVTAALETFTKVQLEDEIFFLTISKYYRVELNLTIKPREVAILGVFAKNVGLLLSTGLTLVWQLPAIIDKCSNPDFLHRTI